MKEAELPHDRRILTRIRIALLLFVLVIVFEPADRWSYPLVNWEIYVDPSKVPEWVESPVLVFERHGRIDTVFAAQLFTPVEWRLSEKVVEGAFGAPGPQRDGYRLVLARRLGVSKGTDVRGLLLRWKLMPIRNGPILDRTRPTEVIHLGAIIIGGGGSP